MSNIPDHAVQWLIEFVGKDPEDAAERLVLLVCESFIEQEKEIEGLQGLLGAYRRKRACDGLNGRTWDAIAHFNAEEEVRDLETAQTTQSEADDG